MIFARSFSATARQGAVPFFRFRRTAEANSSSSVRRLPFAQLELFRGSSSRFVSFFSFPLSLPSPSLVCTAFCFYLCVLRTRASHVFSCRDMHALKIILPRSYFTRFDFRFFLVLFFGLSALFSTSLCPLSDLTPPQRKNETKQKTHKKAPSARISPASSSP